MLEVASSSAGTDPTVFDGTRSMTLTNTNTTNGNMNGFDFRTNDLNGLLTTGAKIMGVYSSHAANAVSGFLSFLTRNAGVISEKMRLTEAGNLGIGTTTPYSKLSVWGDNTSANTRMFELTNSASTTLASMANNGTFYLKGNVGIATTTPLAPLHINGYNEYGYGLYVDMYGNQTVGVALGSPGNVATVQAMGGGFLALNPAGGNVGINVTSTGYRLGIGGNSGTVPLMGISDTASDEIGRSALDFYRNQSLVGQIVTTLTTTSYTSVSDRRIKENIVETSRGLDTLMKLPVRDFSFIRDTTHSTTTGFIAQEVKEVFPEAVFSNGDDGITELGTSTPWSVDYGRITPLIVKAVQDLSNKTDDFISKTTSVKSCSLGLTTDINGNVSGCVASDQSLKKNIKPLTTTLQTLLDLSPVTYQWKDTTKDTMVHSGFIAQMVEKVFPSAVVSAGANIKGVDSNAILSLVVKSFQDFYKQYIAKENAQDKQIAALQTQVAAQQKQINRLIKLTSPQ
jgi:hypothetical protein